MALARKGKKGWMSEGSQEYSRNLRGSAHVLKQKSGDTEKVWWFPLLVRGKLHVDLLPSTFPGECPEGAATLANMIPSVLNKRFPQSAKPRIVMTDRGKGFYHTANAQMTEEYRAALRAHGLRAFMGENAMKQPGDLQER